MGIRILDDFVLRINQSMIQQFHTSFVDSARKNRSVYTLLRPRVLYDIPHCLDTYADQRANTTTTNCESKLTICPPSTTFLPKVAGAHQPNKTHTNTTILAKHPHGENIRRSPDCRHFRATLLTRFHARQTPGVQRLMDVT